MRVNEIVTETFDTLPVSWNGPFHTEDVTSYEFTVGDNGYVVEFIDYTVDENEPKTVEAEFYVKHQNAHDSMKYDLTNTGNQYTVLTTVIAIIKTYIVSNNVSELKFSAKEPSRSRVYDRLLKKYLPGSWDVTKEYDSEHGTVYTIRERSSTPIE